MIKGAASLKARIKNLAVEKRVSPHLLLQNYMFERFLERVSQSSYRDKFVVKGGTLIAALVGITSRSTMDLDVVLQRNPLDEVHVRTAVDTIASVAVDDGVRFAVESVRPIRPDDEYGGFRTVLRAFYETIRVPMSLDITTGDTMTPGAVQYTFTPMFSEDGAIHVWAYNVETILAEKLETILRRGIFNSRSRDFYDIYILSKTQKFNIAVLREAVRRTAKHRDTVDLIKDTPAILRAIGDSEELAGYWENYRREYEYARDISFCDILVVLNDLIGALDFEEPV